MAAAADNSNGVSVSFCLELLSVLIFTLSFCGLRDKNYLQIQKQNLESRKDSGSDRVESDPELVLQVLDVEFLLRAHNTS